MHWKTETFIRLALLRYLLYRDSLELNLQYLWDKPVNGFQEETLVFILSLFLLMMENKQKQSTNPCKANSSPPLLHIQVKSTTKISGCMSIPRAWNYSLLNYTNKVMRNFTSALPFLIRKEKQTTENEI